MIRPDPIEIIAIALPILAEVVAVTLGFACAVVYVALIMGA